ncbi:MAG: peptidase T [Deltaproteobacteria bacterium]|nr:peptidase T [Deltaproteobacteria bacterium]
MKHLPSIIVHGGAGPIKDDSLPARLAGCREAVLAGQKILNAGGSALDAVEAAVVILEDNPLFNAGTGSTLNSLGCVECDAALMEGDTLRVGAVAAVCGIKNPVRLARRVMEDGRHVLLAGDGANLFARSIGFAECSPDALIVESEKRHWESKHGTVGCVACDRGGKLAAATSTGGVFKKLPGRVGDSPLIGCGTYADEFGAASGTGHGEAFIRLLLAKRAVGHLEDGLDAPTAAQKVIALLGAKLSASGGIILIDRNGNIGFDRNTTHMPVCSVIGDAEPTTSS